MKEAELTVIVGVVQTSELWRYGRLSSVSQNFQFTDGAVVGGGAGAVEPAHSVGAVSSMEAGVGIALIAI